MDFLIIDWRGHKVLKAMGEIVPGDATRFSEAIVAADPLVHGLPIVLLESVGGSVSEALKIAGTLKEMPVHMIVPSGARCASACASILFIAGRLRTVEEGGLIGQHSCSRDGVADQLCNSIISQHAFENGVPYGSVAAFVNYVAPREVVWFSRENVDCWGISRYAFEKESGYERSDPCVVKQIAGKYPRAQNAWRVDFYLDGYRAFIRAGYDHSRELQLNLFCDENVPGNLFLSLEIAGPATNIKNAIVAASILSDLLSYDKIKHRVVQRDPNYSEVIFRIPRSDVIKFLTKIDELKILLSLKKPLKPIFVKTNIASSRKALIFAANNCMGK